jgi:hypothetical protein
MIIVWAAMGENLQSEECTYAISPLWRIAFTAGVILVILGLMSPGLSGVIPFHQWPSRLRVAIAFSLAFLVGLVGVYRTRIVLNRTEKLIHIRGLFLVRRLDLSELQELRPGRWEHKLVDRNGRTRGRVTWFLGNVQELLLYLEAIVIMNQYPSEKESSKLWSQDQQSDD